MLDGCIISGGRIHRSVLCPRVRINSFSEVEESVLFENVDIGRHAKIRRAIVDKDVEIPAGHAHRLRPGGGPAPVLVSERGIVVIPKRAKLAFAGREN